MSLAQGRPYLAIPGPSVMPDRVLAAMHRPAPNIYTGDLFKVIEGILPDLRRVARTVHRVAIYIGNGHAAWEAVTTNLFSRGDRALALVTGMFGTNWAVSVRAMGVEVDEINFGKHSPADPARLTEALRADTSGRIKAVMVTHVDTATSVRNDLAALRAAIDAAGHPALLVVDAIASLGCDPIQMDAWGVDVLFAASQKGLMTPPGLAFVWFNEKARLAGEGAGLRSPYWDWSPRTEPGQYSQLFCGTAPTHHLYGLREALTMLLEEEGLEAAWARHERLARAVWAAFDTWAEGGPIQLNIAEPAHRSRAVTTVSIGAPNGTALRDWVESQAGVTLGVGLGMAAPGDPAWHGFFRVAHMGHVNAHMTLGVLSVIEAGLTALKIPHGSGALEAAAFVVAGG